MHRGVDGGGRHLLEERVVDDGRVVGLFEQVGADRQQVAARDRVDLQRVRLLLLLHLVLERRHPLHRLRVLLARHRRDRLADELRARLRQHQRVVHHGALVVRVVAHSHHFRRSREVYDCLGLLHGHDDPALGLGLREQPPVRTPHRQQHAPADPVGEAMDKVVDGVGAVHVDGGDGVGEREELRNVALHQLIHVRHVADHQRALPQPGKELTAGEEAEEEGEEEREEDVDDRVEGEGNVFEPVVLVLRDGRDAIDVFRPIAPHALLDREERRVT
mmetsp:Transcript_6318/g.14644  ORF Transcript_6318/g.14644 Transcript_6318/m.14644 type:complete len:275 (-) Transcript_6318:3087-3911(-)